MSENLDLTYYRVTDIWKAFCEEHTKLLELTFDEYSYLLGSEIDKVEEVAETKSEILKKIDNIDLERQGIIKDINQKYGQSLGNVAELLGYMQTLPEEKEFGHLAKFNALLIDIIEKIQDQNKKNQLFINKAIHSLRDIRETAMGKKSYQTYNKSGKAANKTANV